jgi:hypothetical protein
MPDNALWLIPAILSITLGIGTIITVIVTLHRAKMRELDQRHTERMAAIDKGLDPFPPQETRERAEGAVVPGPDGTGSHRQLLRGLLWLGVGLAVALGSGGLGYGFWSFMGWIAAAVGAAYVIYYVLEGRKHPTAPASPPPPPDTNRT